MRCCWNITGPPGEVVLMRTATTSRMGLNSTSRTPLKAMSMKRLITALTPRSRLRRITEERHAVDGANVDASAHNVEQVGHDLEFEFQVLTQLYELQELRVTAPGQREENLVGPRNLGDAVQLGDPAHHRHTRKAGSGCAMVVHHAHDLEPILRKHVHSLDQELAFRPGADHQHPLRPDALPAKPGLELPQKVALPGHQKCADQDAVNDRQPRVVGPQVAQRDGGEYQDGREADPGVEMEQEVHH